MVPKAPKTQAVRNRMAIAWLESPAYTDSELDRILLETIRNGHVIYNYPDLFQITQEGMAHITGKK
jgi:hypothetical protein